MKSLGGTLFIRNGGIYDYCTKEAVQCLQELCDEIIVVDAGSTDDTPQLLKSLENKKTKIICLPKQDWFAQEGREKLAYFTNVAIASLSTDWNINLQADEVIHQDCFSSIREAIEQDEEGYFVRRINLWGNTQHQLNVSHDRIPVGIEIVRLAKTKYFSIGDAQSLHVLNPSWEYLDRIRFYHFGFVRNPYVHVKKIEQMLTEIFLMDNDKKVVEMGDKFNPWIHFSKEDVIPIQESLPKFALEWAKIRDKMMI